MSLIKAEAVDIENMKVADLRKHLRSLGLPSVGNKPELIERLQDALLTKGEESSEESVEEEDPGVKSGDILNESAKEDDILQDDLSCSPAAKPHLVEELYGANDKKMISSNLSVPFKKRVALEKAVADDISTRPSVISNASMSTDSLSEEEKKSGNDSATLDEISPIESQPGSKAASPKSPKKIVIQRYSFKPLASSSPNETPPKSQHVKIEFGNEAKKNGAAIPVSSNASSLKKVSDEEKIALRAKRFNIKSDSTVKEPNREPSASLKPKDNLIPKTSISTASNLELMKKRAARFGDCVSVIMKKEAELEQMRKRGARFGVNVSTVMKKLEDNEKIIKRKEKFGSVAGSSAVQLEDEVRLMKRKQRFGDISASGVSANEQEKKKRRLERFGL